MAVVHHPAIARQEQPTISVCIANFNGEGLLVDCITSVLSQAGDLFFEIIVHDDASDDGSLQLLRESYPQIEILAATENVGFCIANNRMVAHARGEYVLLLNNDASLLPDALATLLAAAQARIAPGILTLAQYDWETGDLVDVGCLLDPFYNPVPNLDSVRDIAYGIGACLWIPRKLWLELGGFPAWMGSIGEDMFLCCAARLRGYSVQPLPGSGYRHRQGASFGGNRTYEGRLASSYRRRYLSERNRLAVLIICTPTWMAWPWLSLHVAVLLGEGLILSLLKATPRVWHEIYWAALRETFNQRRILLARRRSEQSNRRIKFSDYLRAFSPIPRKLVLLFRFGNPGLQ